MYETVSIVQLESPVGPGLLSVNSSSAWDETVWIFFHSAHGNGNSWRSILTPLLDTTDGTVTAGEVPLPIIISLSFGELWFVTPAEDNTPSMSGYFQDTIIPTILESIPSDSRIWGIGQSMGGFNLLSVYLDDPELWDGLVFLSPALIPLSPYADRQEIIDYHKESYWKLTSRLKVLLGRNNGYPVEKILKNQQMFIPVEADWNTLSPLARLQESVETGTINTRVFLSCSRKDPFGLIYGSIIMESELMQAGAEIETRYHAEEHMHIPYKELNSFLSRH